MNSTGGQFLRFSPLILLGSNLKEKKHGATARCKFSLARQLETASQAPFKDKVLDCSIQTYENNLNYLILWGMAGFGILTEPG